MQSNIVEDAIVRLKSIAGYFSDGQANYFRRIRAEINDDAELKIELQFSQNVDLEIQAGMVSAMGLCLMNFRKLLREYDEACKQRKEAA